MQNLIQECLYENIHIVYLQWQSCVGKRVNLQAFWVKVWPVGNGGVAASWFKTFLVFLFTLHWNFRLSHSGVGGRGEGSMLENTLKTLVTFSFYRGSSWNSLRALLREWGGPRMLHRNPADGDASFFPRGLLVNHLIRQQIMTSRLLLCTINKYCLNIRFCVP